MAEPSPQTAKSPPAWLVRTLIGLLSLIWGSTWLVIKVGLETLPPFTSAAVRFVVAALVMALIAPLLARREGGTRPKTWIWTVVGLSSFSASYAIVYWTESKLPSALVSILWSVFPMLMAISSHFFLDHPLRGLRPWLGFVLGFAGVVLLFVTDLQGLGPDAIPAACVLLCSPLVSCVSTTLVKRHAHGASSALLNRNGMALGALVLCALALLLERDASPQWTAPAVWSVLYLSLAGTVLSFGLYFWLLRHTPAHELSLISYLTPAVALLCSGLLGHEPITAFTLAGCATILVGVFLVIGGPRASNVPRQ